MPITSPLIHIISHISSLQPLEMRHAMNSGQLWCHDCCHDPHTFHSGPPLEAIGLHCLVTIIPCLYKGTPYKEPLVWDLIIFDLFRAWGKMLSMSSKHLKTRFQNSSRGCLETKRPATSRHSAVTLPGFGKGIRDDRDVEASWHNSPGTCFFPTLKGLNSYEPSKLEDI